MPLSEKKRVLTVLIYAMWISSEMPPPPAPTYTYTYTHHPFAQSGNNGAECEGWPKSD